MSSLQRNDGSSSGRKGLKGLSSDGRPQDGPAASKHSSSCRRPANLPMAKKSRDRVTINHLPGILLASAAECRRWVEAGLVPIAGRDTVRKGGRIQEVPVFDPEAVAQLAAEVPLWRARDGAGDSGSTSGSEDGSEIGRAHV